MESFAEYKASLGQNEPPGGLPPLLQALWWDAKGEWGRAHEVAQDIGTPEAAWVHAYLHRKEGDHWNAGHWYSCAGKPKCTQSLEQEWEEIAGAFLRYGAV